MVSVLTSSRALIDNAENLTFFHADSFFLLDALTANPVSLFMGGGANIPISFAMETFCMG
jgi:hypothetical protein